MMTKRNELKQLDLHPGKQIDGKRCNRTLFELQAELYNALKLEYSKEDIQKIHAKMLTKFETRALAVRKVTTNSGGKTAGVDGQIGLKDEQKGLGIQWLKDLNGNRYKCEPIKRVYIPKHNSSEKRPLSIPTMKDRAAQAIGNFILDVHQEHKADDRSFGFRIGRNARQAIGFIHKNASGPQQKRRILSIDIKKAYDSVKHKGILDNIPIQKSVLKTWLKAKISDKGTIIHPTMGVPQGGPISPTIFNCVTNGLDREVTKVKFCTPVRFADDILVLARTDEQLDEALENIKKFLGPRGLEINDKKTVKTDIETGFDYLGYNIREYADKTRTGKKGFKNKKGIVICKPSKKSVASIKGKIKEIITKYAKTSAGVLIMKLNPLLRGGANYFNAGGGGTNAKNKLGLYIGKLLESGVLKKHRKFKGGTRKLMKKYFKSVQRRKTYKNNGTFFGKTLGKEILLTDVQEIKVKNENVLPFREEVNPYNPEEYERFMTRNRSTTVKDIAYNKQKQKLFTRQGGMCGLCNGGIDGTEETQIDHIIPKAEGGSNDLKNLQIVHTTCHQQKTAVERRIRKLQKVRQKRIETRKTQE